MILVFCLTATSRALAQKGDQVTQDAESRQVPEDRGSGGDTNSAEHQFSLNEDQLEFLLLVVALAAYLRLRIEWSKKLVNRRHRWLVSLMLLVELLIAAVGFMLVCRIFSKPLDRTPSAWLDRWILGLFVVSVGGFAVLLVVQLVFDVYWMCNGGRVSLWILRR